MTEVLSAKILEWARSRSGRKLVTAQELLPFGSRAAIDQALARLHGRGELVRVVRGVYALPVEGKYGRHLPAPAAVAEAIAARRNESVVTHGAVAANRLGLTTQVPVREVYLTGGATQHVEVGRQQVELRHAPAWQLVFPGAPAGDVVRALAWLGPARAHEAREQIRRTVPRAELEQLRAVTPVLPSWLAREVVELAHAA